jgi:carbonic anhydrase
VREQVMHVCRTASVWDAWEHGRELAIHGWVYGLADGLLRDLGVSVRSQAEFEQRNRFGMWSSERAQL